MGRSVWAFQEWSLLITGVFQIFVWFCSLQVAILWTGSTEMSGKIGAQVVYCLTIRQVTDEAPGREISHAHWSFVSWSFAPMLAVQLDRIVLKAPAISSITAPQVPG